jgi:transcription elongation GreA/GreB family factor
MTKEEIKNKLFETCEAEISRQIAFSEEQMSREQKTANMYKGAMESRYDTFKEEAQARKDMNAMTVERLLKQKSILMSSRNSKCQAATPGAVVETQGDNYFILFYLFEDGIELNGKEYFVISLESPVGTALRNKKTGDKFHINGREIEINDIY